MPRVIDSWGTLWSEPGTAALGTTGRVITTAADNWLVPLSTTGQVTPTTGTTANWFSAIETHGSDYLDLEFTSKITTLGAAWTGGGYGASPYVRIIAVGQRMATGNSSLDTPHEVGLAPQTTTNSTVFQLGDQMYQVSPDPIAISACTFTNATNTKQSFWNGGTVAQNDVCHWRVTIGDRPYHTATAGTGSGGPLKLNGIMKVWIAVDLVTAAITGAISDSKMVAELRYILSSDV